MKRSAARSLFVSGLLAAALLVGFAGSSHAIDMLTVYNQAGPGEGYDKLLVLDRHEVYTGTISISGAIEVCIRGNGARWTVGGGDIRVWGGSTLDIYDTVINGQHALMYMQTAGGHISGNTIYGGFFGIYAVMADVTIENNIIANNSQYGVAVDEYMLPYAQYNNVWNNAGGDYMYFCSG